LEEAGYKQQLNSSDKDDIDAIPGEATLRILNLTRNQFIIEVKARFIGSLSTTFINSPTICVCPNQEKETSETSPESENLSEKDKQSA
jgi:hypothetical protein